jgi:hypothetical protein
VKFPVSITVHLRRLFDLVFFTCLVFTLVFLFLVFKSEKSRLIQTTFQKNNQSIRDLEQKLGLRLKTLQESLMGLIDSQAIASVKQGNKLKLILREFLTEEEWKLWQEGAIGNPVSLALSQEPSSSQVSAFRINLALMTRSFLIKEFKLRQIDFDLECHFLHDSRVLRFSKGQRIKTPSTLIFPKNSPVLHSSNSFNHEGRKQGADWFIEFSNFGRLRPGTSAHFQFEDLKETSYFASAKFSVKLGNGTIIIARNIEADLLNLHKKWGLYVLGLIISLLVFIKIKSRILLNLGSEISDCLSFVIADSRKPFPQEKVEDELSLLKHKITRFDEAISDRLLSYHLQLGLQRILNTPSKGIKHYLEEADYFVRDLAYDLRWTLEKTPGKEDAYLISMAFDKKQIDFLQSKLQISQPFQAEFKIKIEQKPELIEIFTDFFRNLVEKCMLQEARIKSQILKAELSIAKQVQDKLTPLDLHQEAEICNFFYSTDDNGSSANRLGNIYPQDDGFRFYLGSISETGIAASLSAMQLKSFLDILTQKEDGPESIFRRINKSLIAEESKSEVKLAYGCYERSTHTLSMVCSGNWLLQTPKGSQIISCKTNQPPLGVNPENHYGCKEFGLLPGEFFYCCYLDQDLSNSENSSASILNSEVRDPNLVFSTLESTILGLEKGLSRPLKYQHLLGYLCD